MQVGGKFPGDQAEIVFTDVFVEYLADLDKAEQLSVVETIESLTRNPAGKYPLKNSPKLENLAGVNTVETLGGEHRVIYRPRAENGVEVIEVVVGGPRRGDEVYTAAKALEASGRLTADEVTQIWDALDLLAIASDAAGLASWDYRPDPTDAGHRTTVVKAGVLPADIAAVLSKDELNEAMAAAWSDGTGIPNQEDAIEAALRRARSNSLTARELVASRVGPRCGWPMPRVKRPCVRREGHPGAHRSVP